MNLKGLNAPVEPPSMKEEISSKHRKRRLFMKKDKKKFFGKKVFGNHKGMMNDMDEDDMK